MFGSIIVQNPYGTKNACKPWNSLDALKRGAKITTHDTQEETRRCRSCPLEKCTGSEKCWYRLGLEPPVEKAHPLDRDGVGRRLLDQGMGDKKIAEAVGISQSAVAAWRKRNGLAAGRFRKKGGRAT